MQHNSRFLSAALAAVMFTIPALAGGFWITLGNPEASSEAKAMNAVLTLMFTGCGNPAAAKVTAAGASAWRSSGGLPAWFARRLK